MLLTIKNRQEKEKEYNLIPAEYGWFAFSNEGKPVEAATEEELIALLEDE